jgi:trans-aconitate methyltransferase
MAILYEKARPQYDDSIISNISSYIQLTSNTKILEIGCGTGKATELLAKTPCIIHCIDIGENLLEIARNKFKNNAHITFEKCFYEKLNTKTKYDIIFAATAYHWIPKPEGDIKTVELLKPNGLFVIVQNHHNNQNDSYFVESQDIYKNYLPKDESHKNEVSLLNSEYFELIKKFEFFWEEEYPTEKYFDLLSTYSEHIALEEGKRQQLFNELKELVNKKYGGKIIKKYKTITEIGRLR